MYSDVVGTQEELAAPQLTVTLFTLSLITFLVSFAQRLDLVVEAPSFSFSPSPPRSSFSSVVDFSFIPLTSLSCCTANAYGIHRRKITKDLQARHQHASAKQKARPPQHAG